MSPRSFSSRSASSASAPGRGAQHPELLAVPAAQVARDGARDPGIVVDAEQDRFAHAATPPWSWPSAGSPRAARGGGSSSTLVARTTPGPSRSRSRTTCTGLLRRRGGAVDSLRPGRTARRRCPPCRRRRSPRGGRRGRRPPRRRAVRRRCRSCRRARRRRRRWRSGSSRASRPSRLSPADSSDSVVPQSSTAHGRSGGDQPVSRTSRTPRGSSRVSSGSRTPEASSGSVPSVP